MSDCIDRQTIINLLTSRAETLRGLYGDLGGAASGVRKLVQTLPSVEPERKKGKWMEKETFDNADYEIPVWQSARCSVCGKYMTAPYQYYFTDFSYCPNCGSYNGADNEK